MGQNRSKWVPIDILNINKQLIILKVAFFLVFATWYSQIPYLTLMSHKIGISFEEMAIFSSCLPVLSTFSPIISGFIADKIGDYKLILMGSLLLSVLPHMAIIWIYDQPPTNSNSTHLSMNLNLSHWLHLNASGYDFQNNDIIHSDQYEMMNFFRSNCSHLLENMTNCEYIVPFNTDVEKGKEESDFQNLSSYFSNCPFYCFNSTNPHPQMQQGHLMKFGIVLLLRTMGAIGLDVTGPILDAACASMVKKYHGNLGIQRIWGMVSIIITPIICGLLLDYMEEIKGYKDYSIVFYLSGAITLLIIPLVSKLDIDVQKNRETFLRSGKKIMKMVDVDVFLLMQLLVGLCWGLHMIYGLYFYEKELNASKFLMGLSTSTIGIGGVLVSITSDVIIKKLRQPNVVSLGLITASVRFITLYFLKEPWLIIPFDFLEAISSRLPFTAGYYFCVEVAPPGLLASMSGLNGAATFGAGRSAGQILGGILIAKSGVREAYLYIGILAGVFGISYLFLYNLLLKKYQLQRLNVISEKLKEDPKNLTINHDCTDLPVE